MVDRSHPGLSVVRQCVLKSLARRYVELHDEIAELDAMIASIVGELVPDLVARNAIGHETAAQILITTGDDPERLSSEASFAAFCGISPVPASSGKNGPASFGPRWGLSRQQRPIHYRHRSSSD
jgi:transposase